jgi:hypothetical protein
VDLIGRTIEVYINPTSDAPEPRYGEPQMYDEGAALPVTLDGVKVGEVTVSSILA